MHTPQVFVVRAFGDQYAVHPLDSELVRCYPTEFEAVRHAQYLLRWLGHSGETIRRRFADGTLHVSLSRAVHVWNLNDI